MNITQALPIINAHLDACVPIMVDGPPGVGKTDLFHQIARERDWYINDNFRASTIDPVDLRGIPSIVNGHTVFNPPADLPDEARDGPEGILLFDEINTGIPMLQATMHGIVHEGRLATWTKPKGCRIGATGNRISDRANAQKLSTSLAGRFGHVTIEPEFPPWKLWALQNNILPEIISFLEWQESRKVPCLFKASETPDARAYPSPRSWERTSRVIEKAPPKAFEIAEANIGTPVAIEFKGFLDVFTTMPRLPEIFANPTTARVPLEASAKYAISGALSRAATPQNLQAIVTYMKRVGPEFSTICVTDAIRREELLKQAPGFSDWAIANQHVTL
jgi:hypothetical protein